MSKTRLWTLDTAVAFVREHQPHVMHLGYYIALGGGVLNKGWSDNDLDLVVVCRDINSEISMVTKYFASLLGGEGESCHLDSGYHVSYPNAKVEILYIVKRWLKNV